MGAHFAPHVTLGEAYLALGQWEEAAAILEKGHALQPQEAMTLGMLAGARVRLGERARADELLARMGNDPQPLIGRVLYHWVCGENAQAAEPTSGRSTDAIRSRWCSHRLHSTRTSSTHRAGVNWRR